MATIKSYTDEIWKDVVGWEGLYQVSSFGRVKSFRKKEPRLLSTCVGTHGYCVVLLHDGKGQRKNERVHRLVAMAFIPNPNNLPEINHKDEDKDNNRVDNLEWCDRDYNMQYGTWVSRNPRLRPVAQFSLDGKFIKEYKTIREASRETGIRHGNIRNCAAKQIINKEKGYYTKSAGGYKWEFVDK